MNKINSVICLSFLVLLLSCSPSDEKKTTDTDQKNQPVKVPVPKNAVKNTVVERTPPNISSDSKLDFKTIQLEEGWGYEIYKDSSLLITQKNIPAVQGLLTFKTEEQAEKTAEFVANKIKKGIGEDALNI